jgi:hypothetical protein
MDNIRICAYGCPPKDGIKSVEIMYKCYFDFFEPKIAQINIKK